MIVVVADSLIRYFVICVFELTNQRINAENSCLFSKSAYHLRTYLWNELSSSSNPTLSKKDSAEK